MILGVTGGIASGKSTAVRYLQALGASIIDADAIARILTAPGGPLARKIIASLGTKFARQDDPAAIDRSKLGQAVFHSEAIRRQLEEMTHPPIVQEIRQQIDRYQKAGSKVIVAEIPLLFEVQLASLVDMTLVIWCTHKTQVKRLSERHPNLLPDQISERIDAQLSLDQKRDLADFVISSEQHVDTMNKELRELYDNLYRSSHE